MSTSVDWPLYRGQAVEKSDIGEFSNPKAFFHVTLHLGFDHAFLMFMFLGLGVTNQAPDDSTSDPDLLATLHTYAARSIKGQLVAISSGVNVANFHPLFTGTNLIVCQTTLSGSFSPTVAGIIDWLRCWRGLHSFTRASASSFSGRDVLSDYPLRWHDPSFRIGLVSGDPTFRFLLQGLPRISTSYKTHSAYYDAVGLLGILYRRADWNVHAQFPAEVTAVFVKTAIYLGLKRRGKLRFILAQLHRMFKRLLEQAIDMLASRACRDIIE
ncbi:hypothetical protein GQ53DRAFT_823161 [Thozetella sp. PMI_491]|nr:hypothetical protein GQ53DRAFT_823161 [Thozetella sp. PMI_491]